MGKIALLPGENRQRSECAHQQIMTSEFSCIHWWLLLREHER